MGKSYQGKESKAQNLFGRGSNSEQVLGKNENAVDGAGKLEEMEIGSSDWNIASKWRGLADEAGERSRG